MNILIKDWKGMTDGEKKSALEYAVYLTKKKWERLQ